MIKWLVLTATIVFWGLAFTAIKYSMQFVSPYELASLRFAIAGVLFAASIIAGRLKIEKGDIPQIFLVGLFGVTIYHVCLNAGEMYISSGVASLIVATAPIYVLILARIMLGETIAPQKIVGSLIAITGVAIISQPEGDFSLPGIALTLASAVAAAAYTVLGKKLMYKYDHSTLTNYSTLLGTIPLLPFTLPASLKVFGLCDYTLIASVVFLGVFATYFGYRGWYYFLEREEASRAAVFLLPIPLISTLAGVFLLNETVGPQTFAGGAAILAGILLVVRSPSH